MVVVIHCPCPSPFGSAAGRAMLCGPTVVPLQTRLATFICTNFRGCAFVFISKNQTFKNSNSEASIPGNSRYFGVCVGWRDSGWGLVGGTRGGSTCFPPPTFPPPLGPSPHEFFTISSLFFLMSIYISFTLHFQT